MRLLQSWRQMSHRGQKNEQDNVCVLKGTVWLKRGRRLIKCGLSASKFYTRYFISCACRASLEKSEETPEDGGGRAFRHNAWIGPLKRAPLIWERRIFFSTPKQYTLTPDVDECGKETVCKQSEKKIRESRNLRPWGLEKPPVSSNQRGEMRL